MLEIVLLRKAETDIIAIAEYTKAEHGEEPAKRYIEDLRRQIEFAAEYPGIGGEAFGLPALYRKVRAGLHRAIYRYTETQLTVVRVLHAREDVPDEVEDFW